MIIIGIAMLRKSPGLVETINLNITEKLLCKAIVMDKTKAYATIKHTRIMDTILFLRKYFLRVITLARCELDDKQVR